MANGLTAQDEEASFQSWYKNWANVTGINPNPDDPLHKYDYRAAYGAGAAPKISPEDNQYHWPSEFKTDDHPNRFVEGVDTKTGEQVQTDEFGGIIEPEQAQGFDEFGGTIEQPELAFEQGYIPTTGEKIMNRYVRPVLQGLGTAGGVLIGASTGLLGGPMAPGTVPFGAIVGGGTGYAVGDEMADLLEQFLGMREPQPMMMEIKESGRDILTGMTYEMGGHAIGPAGKAVMGIPKVGPALTKAGQATKRFFTQMPMSAKGVERETGKVFAAMINDSPLIVKNAAEARALEEAIPGLKFNLAQLTDDPNVINFARGKAASPGDYARLQAEQNKENVNAIVKFIEKHKGAGDIEDVFKRLGEHEAMTSEAIEASQKALARETGALRADIDPMDIGGVVSKELRAGEQAARDIAGEKFADVPDQIQVVDDLLDEFKKIMRPLHSDEGAKRFPGILSRSIKTMEEAAKTGEPTKTLKDIQGLRSEILDDLRMAKEHKKPRQLRKRLSDAAAIIDKKLSGEIQEEVGETLYHSSDKVFKSGKPEAPETHFFDEPDTGFGDRMYKINLPKGTKILDLEKVPKSEKAEFFEKVAGKKVDPSEYGKHWSESKKLTKAAKEMGYDVVSYDLDRFVVPKDIIQKSSIPGKVPSKQLKEAQQFFKKEVIDKYHVGASKKLLGETVQDAEAASQYFKMGAKGEQAADEFMTALGDNPAAMTAMKEHVGQTLLDSPAYSHKTGEISMAGLDKWRNSYKYALKKFGMESKFQSLIMARKFADTALRKSKEFEKSAASRMLNADPNDAIIKAFSRGSKKKAAEELMEIVKGDIPPMYGNVRSKAVKNTKTGEVFESKIDHVTAYEKLTKADGIVDDYDIIEGFVNTKGKFIQLGDIITENKAIQDRAVRGLQNAFTDHILAKFSLGGSDDAMKLLSSKKMSENLVKYDAAAKVIFKDSPKKLEAMKQARKAMEFLERTTEGKGSGIEKMGSLITFMAKKYGFSKRAISNVVKATLSRFKGLSDQQMSTLANRALLDPDFAFGLANAARGGKPEKATGLLVQNLVRLGLVAPRKGEEK